eukprot:22149-Pelagococcus_subviridis.AAC.4
MASPDVTLSTSSDARALGDSRSPNSSATSRSFVFGVFTGVVAMIPGRGGDRTRGVGARPEARGAME